MEGGRSPAIGILSPSDMVGPSPVTSNGTVTTDIEDDVSEGVEEQEQEQPASRPRPESDPNVRIFGHHLVRNIQLTCSTGEIDSHGHPFFYAVETGG
jgi:hypothetical protein